MSPTRPHIFLLVCKSKNAIDGTSKKHLGLSRYTHKPIYIWDQCHKGTVLRISIKLCPFLCSCQAKKKDKNTTLAKPILGTTDLKLGMNKLLDSVPPGHTSSSRCGWLKTVCVHVCMLVCIHLIPKVPY